MRILFATGRMLFPFFRGGDGITISQLLSALTCMGVTCKAIGRLDPLHSLISNDEICEKLVKNNIPFKKYNHKVEFSTSIENLLSDKDSFNNTVKETISTFKPDIVITQMEDSHLVIDIANNEKIPTILYIHDVTDENYRSINQYGLSFIFYNSHFTYNYFKANSHIPHAVIHPFVDKDFYLIESNSRQFVTMVNPTPEKGGDILSSCCFKLPEVQFLVINGWNSMKYNSKIEGLKNVLIQPFGIDMRSVFKMTHFVIAPSQVNESFCRIPVEAALNSIPTIASRVGGLPESVGKGGVLIEDFSNADEWVSTIKRLRNNTHKTSVLGERAKRNFQKITHNNVERVYNILCQLV